MQIELQHIGKRYQKEWIFCNLDAKFTPEKPMAIIGSNGSGKSTLAQIASGYLSPSEGLVSWTHDGRQIQRDKIFEHVAMCSPMMQLWDDFTLEENVDFFLRFKKFRNATACSEFMEIIGLVQFRGRQLKHFSSGMRQRLKLGLAIMADTSLLILDEPCSHLDDSAVRWFQTLLQKNLDERLLLIASNNDEREIFSCKEKIDIMPYKP